MSSPRSSKLIRTWSPQAEVNTHSAHLDAQPEAHDVNRGAIWFDDGTIILEVEGVHFRIYEGVLAIQSPLFQSLPYYLPVDAIYCERKIYDQPVLVLSDSQKDWTIALSVLFDPFEQRKFYGGIEQPPISTTTLCACLRLGHKYQIHALTFGAVRRLQNHFPTTFAQMDIDHHHASIELDRPADCFDLANLLRDMGCHPLLPMALFKCITGPGMFSMIVAGASRRDGSWSTLSRDNLLVCVPAWRSLFQELYDRLQHWRDLVDPQCAGSPSCRKQVALIVEEPVQEMVELGGIFRQWKPEWESQMCEGCVESWKARLNLARRDSFRTLPCHFGLSGWDALLNASTEPSD